jgi:hypothetical protein
MSPGEPMRDLVAYLTVLAGPEPAGSYLELRYRTDRGGMRQRFTDAARPAEAAAAIAALSRSHDVYVGCAPRRRRAGGKDAIAEAWTLWADCDTPESIHQLAGFAPQPAIVIRSGRGLHAYWPLAAPLPPEPLERANRRVAHRLGGCQSAVTNAAAILRPPTTANFKYEPPAPVVLARFTGERFAAREVARSGLAWRTIAPRAATLRLPTSRVGTMRSLAASLTLKRSRSPPARLTDVVLVDRRTELSTGATASPPAPPAPPEAAPPPPAPVPAAEPAVTLTVASRLTLTPALSVAVTRTW